MTPIVIQRDSSNTSLRRTGGRRGQEFSSVLKDVRTITARARQLAKSYSAVSGEGYIETLVWLYERWLAVAGGKEKVIILASVAEAGLFSSKYLPELEHARGCATSMSLRALYLAVEKRSREFETRGSRITAVRAAGRSH
ncbi:hypothetical protein UB44_22295 [Burkholderiaceae bacterium 26]|nr:hypothetical protein UB44_22295 [Burkholderiaceae bacterium 26]